MVHGPTKKPISTARPSPSAGVYLAGFAGALALFPQGIVPMVIKLTGGTDRVWFLALYLPRSWQWPVIIAMIAGGLAAWAYALRRYLAARRG